MWDTIIIDTRDLGAMSALMDGMVHIIPKRGHQHHNLQMACWCDPRVVWSAEGGTCLVNHRHRRPPKDKVLND